MDRRQRTAVLALLLLLAACVSPEMQEAIRTLRELEARKVITSQEAERLIAGLEAASGWSTVELVVGNVLAAVAAYFGVMLRRGPPEPTKRRRAAGAD